MCGILLVQTTNSIDPVLHQQAVDVLSARGPDFVITKHIGSVFVAQSVLSITGNSDWYHRPRPDAFAYNGEIYNWRSFGSHATDSELVYQSVKDDHCQFREFQGPWAWCWSDGRSVMYAADAQGERCLYHYQDDNLLIVSSEVRPILVYIKSQIRHVPYRNKTWTMINDTPWQGIDRCEPGRLYNNGKPSKMLDNMFDWSITAPDDLNQAVEEFSFRWKKVCAWTQPQESATLSYSGGVDSGMIAQDIPNLNRLSVDCVGKDPIAASVANKKIAINEQQWAQEYLTIISTTAMPAQSWSYVGKWLVARHSTDRIIFTGLAADELFGGYAIYQQIEYDIAGSHSPYSSHDHDNLWSKCLESARGHAGAATLLMDYWYQVIGMDAPGQDRLAGYWGKECRNPFMCKAIIEFAVSLPWHLRVSNRTKPVLKQYLRSAISDLPKQGFAGHANDSLPWLGVNIPHTGNRNQDWQHIAQQTFYANYQAL